MLILTENRAVNLDQVFFLDVYEVGASYSIMAYPESASKLKDCLTYPGFVMIKSYPTQEGAVADLKKITEAYAAGMRVVDLR